jgi:hydrogenase maturation protease
MRTLVIAIGNTLRRDDGAAHRVVELLGTPGPDVTLLGVHQLAPEIAADTAGWDRIVFVDADVDPGEPRLERLACDRPVCGSFGHAMSPDEVAWMARRLYGFAGEVWLCRIPGFDFTGGEGLSAGAEANARSGARELARLLGPDGGRD